MTWSKLDEKFTTNRKVVSAGPEAAWLYVCALVYCNANETDGAVPRQVLPQLAYPSKAFKLAGRLVEVGLFERQGEDFVIHDFHEYNFSKQQLAERRSKKQAAGRAGGKQRASKRLSNGEAEFKPDSDSDSDSGTDPDSLDSSTVIGARADRSRVENLVARMGDAVPSSSLFEREEVVEKLLTEHDWREVDRMIGYALTLTEKPRKPAYFLRMAETWNNRPKVTPERPEEATLRAQFARMEREECPDCGVSGWVESENGDVPCERCKRVSA